MTQTIVLCRLVGTIDVTFNPLAAIEVDERQLRQGLEAREVACSRNVRVRGCQHGKLSRNVQLLPRGNSTIMTQTIVVYRLVGTVQVTFNPLAALQVNLSQLRQGLEALEVACSRRARVRGCQHGQLSRNVQLLP